MEFHKNNVEKTTAWKRSFPLTAELNERHLDLTVRELLSRLINSQKCDAIDLHHLEFSTIKYVENTQEK